MLFLINPLFLISFCQRWVELHAALRTEVIGWDRLESPSVNILLTTKLLSLDPFSWDMVCLLTLWPLLIPCSLGNVCCTFGFLIFIIVERNFLYNSLYILRERSLKHLCSIRAWVPMSFSLSLFLSLSLSTPSSSSPFHFLIIDSRPPGSGLPQQVATRTGTLVYVAFQTDWLRAYWGRDILRSISTKTRVKRLESPIISVLCLIIYLSSGTFVFMPMNRGLLSNSG